MLTTASLRLIGSRQLQFCDTAKTVHCYLAAANETTACISLKVCVLKFSNCFVFVLPCASKSLQFTSIIFNGLVHNVMFLYWHNYKQCLTLQTPLQFTSIIFNGLVQNVMFLYWQNYKLRLWLFIHLHSSFNAAALSCSTLKKLMLNVNKCPGGGNELYWSPTGVARAKSVTNNCWLRLVMGRNPRQYQHHRREVSKLSSVVTTCNLSWTCCN